MLKTKVKISNIDNLTDARYFAAMGVDYLGFCCNPGSEFYCSPAKIKEITEWVEGPQFVLEFSGWQKEDEIIELLTSGLAGNIHLGVFADYKSEFSLPVFKDYIFENIENDNLDLFDFPVIRSERKMSEFNENDQNKLLNLLQTKSSFLDINFSKDELLSILDTFHPYGLILRGGEEEKVGVKSFEDLDEIFELLEEN